MKVKNLLKMAVAAFLISGLSVSSAMATTNEATGQADATIVQPITIAEQQGLNFGNSLPAEIITINNFGAVTGDTLLVDKGTQQQGIFIVTGGASLSFTPTIPSTVLLTGPGDDITANLNCTNPTPIPLALDGGGLATISCGGDMQSAVDQAPGAYDGTYLVTVNYP